MLDAGELCNRQVVIATADESILAAARRMRDHRVGCLVDGLDVLAGEVDDLAAVLLASSGTHAHP